MEKETKNSKLEVSHVLFYLALALVGVAIIFAIVFWLRGETKTYGDYPNPESNESLKCESVGFSYPFFSHDNARKRTTKINAVFGKDELKTISLIYVLNYDDVSEIESSEASNHIAMNESFYEDNLGPDSFDANYARLSDALKFTISADASKIYNGGGAKYFLLNDIEETPYSIKNVKNTYQKKGFKCEQN